MNRAQPHNVVTAFANHLDIEFDPFELQEANKLLQTQPIFDIESFGRHLHELGSIAHLSFLNNYFDEMGFWELIETGYLPVLVFLDGQEPIPFLIKKIENQIIYGLLFEEDIIKEVTFTLREIINKLYLDKTQSSKLRHNTQHTFLVLTPLSVAPLVSDRFKTEQAPKPLRRFWNLLRNERKDIGFIYIFAIISGLLSLTTPLGVQAIIGLISGGLLLEPIIVLICLVIAGTLFSGLLQVAQVRVVETIKQRIFAKVAFEFAFRIPRIKIEAINQSYAPELMNRFFDILTVQKGLAKLLIDMLGAVLQIFFGLGLLVFYHPYFVFFGIFLVSIITSIFYFTSQKGIKTSNLESKYKYRVAHWLEEIARTMATFKLAGFTNISLEKMDGHVNKYLKKRQEHFKVLLAQYISIVAFKTLITAALLIIGVLLVIDRQITLGQFVASELIIIILINAAEKIITNLDSIYDILTALDKIGSVTDLPLDHTKGIMFQNIGIEKGFDIKIRNLKYKYPESLDYVLNGVSLDINAGEKVAIVGADGSGKSTLLHLISGLLEAYIGTIAINGISLRDINLTSLRDDIGDILSLEDIFDGTIQDNITVGKSEISFQDMMYAIEKVGLSDYINKLPKGLQTHLIAGGRQLPRSVVMKIIMARSMAEKPRLVVIDDFFLNIEKSIQHDVAELFFHKETPWTVVAVTHHPLILSHCDKIVVFYHGKVEACVSYEQLLHNPDLRKHINFFVET